LSEEKFVILPHKFVARPHQKKFLAVMNRKFKNAFLVWHRRAGKDLTAFNFLIKESQKKVGTYIYCMPTFSQCKRNIWDAITTDGTKFLDCIPEEILESKNESELQLKFKNGSIIQLASAEKYDRLRGINARGFILSEFAYMHPNVLKVIGPVLLESGGFLVILTTPKGKNHAYTLWEQVSKYPDTWFTELLSVRMTKNFDGTPVMSEEAVKAEQRERGLTDEEVKAEYYCSFEGAISGTYYEKLLIQAEQEGRIGTFPWNPKLPVFTAWDIGVNDSAAIWFYQMPYGSINIIDHYENSGLGIEHYIKYLAQKPYMYPFSKAHFVPHDFKNRAFGIPGANAAKSTYDTAIELQSGKNNFAVMPRISKKAFGIQEVRSILPRCNFNRVTCQLVLDALMEYHAKYDQINETTSISPVHDWSSNSADAFQTLALSIPSQKRGKTQEEMDLEVNPLNRYFTEGVDKFSTNKRTDWMRN
jgi:hypothetical protein